MATMTFPSQFVLEGVEPLHFYDGKGPRCPEDITFPSAMRTVMEYLGENLGCKSCRPNDRGMGMGCSYAYFMGVSGLAFAMDWAPGFNDRTYAVANYLSSDPTEMYRRSFASVGYGCERLSRDAGDAAYREKIKASLYEHRRPVIGFGIVGPPEASIVTGYEADGDVLVGTTFFQFEEPQTPVDPAGYFHRKDWFGNTHDLVFVGEKSAAPDQKEILLDALRFGARIMAQNEMHGVPTGAAAYDAWAEDLLRDETFPADDEASLRQRYQIHDFIVGQVAELRWYGAVWLTNMYERVHYRQVEPLLKAAGSLAAEHALMWRVWDLFGGLGNTEAWRELAKSDVRREVAAVIRQSREKYLETARYVEEVLKV